MQPVAEACCQLPEVRPADSLPVRAQLRLRSAEKLLLRATCHSAPVQIKREETASALEVCSRDVLCYQLRLRRTSWQKGLCCLEAPGPWGSNSQCPVLSEEPGQVCAKPFTRQSAQRTRGSQLASPTWFFGLPCIYSSVNCQRLEVRKVPRSSNTGFESTREQVPS